ncbi:MAG: hypothetical protein RKO66_13950 [Candidatus Contendobacter sp.]|nr:hypothetical protein [Candidatus Contendobacter sp.]
MNKLEKVLLSSLPWIGIITTVIAGVLKAVDNQSNWPQYLVATSVFAFWPIFIINSKNVNDHISEVNDHISEIEKTAEYITQKISEIPNVRSSASILKSAMRVGFLNREIEIDNQFWLEYCNRVSTDNEGAALEALKKILEALRTNTVSVKSEDVYYLMEVLCLKICNDVNKYHAVATQVDLEIAKKNDDNGIRSKHFIFKFPLDYPRRVKRLFCVSKSDLKKLPDDMKGQLGEQIDKGVELHVSFNGFNKDNPLNHGIYGEVAVGELGCDGTNKVKFSREEARRKRQDFDILWNSSIPLEKSHLT